jgi:hypothetical protein
MRKYLVLFIALLLMSAGALFAANPGTANTNAYSANLTISATVQDAVLLSLSTGTLAGISHCAIAGTNPNYTMSFGTVDALAVNTGCGNVFAPTTPGQSAAVYYTDYQLTPAWAGLAATSAATLTAFATAPEAGVNIQIPSTSTDQNTTAGLNVGTWSTLGSTAGTATPVVSGTVLSGAGADGTAVTRFLALSVSPTATAAAGSGTNVSTTVTFTMTIK